ncbi:MAG: glycosyltransferase 87 family protein [Candidatus Caenarcaniphilales bacterium]|nr:glycosyltransferase 87 family protein [Candidatus Caenarcaniphilales bacterium]
MIRKSLKPSKGVFKPKLKQEVKSQIVTSLKSFLCILLLIFGFWYSSFYLQRGLFFAKHRPQRLDISAYFNVTQILKKGFGKRLYDYRFQDLHSKDLFKHYLSNSLEPFTGNKFLKFTNNDLKLLEDRSTLAGNFYYPPQASLFGLLLAPLSLLNLYILLNAFSVGVLLLAIFLVFKKYNLSKFWIVLFVASLLCFQPWNHALFHGQISVLICSCFFFYYFFHERQRPIQSGIFLALSLLKPQLGIGLFLITLLQKDFKAVFYGLLFTLGLLGLSLPIIGFEGVKDYFLAFLQLSNIFKIGLWAPRPVEPIYPVLDWTLLFFTNVSACGLWVAKLSKILTISVSLCALGSMIWIASKEQCRQVNPLRFALLTLLSFFLFQYHHTHEYSLIVFCLLVAMLCNEGGAKKIILWFSFFCSFLPVLLELMFGAEALVYVYHLHVLWIVALTTSIFLWSKLEFCQSGLLSKPITNQLPLEESL